MARVIRTKFRIVAGGSVYGWKLAANKEDAMKRWMAEYSYDSMEDAAREHFCAPSDIRVVTR